MDKFSRKSATRMEPRKRISRPGVPVAFVGSLILLIDHQMQIKSIRCHVLAQTTTIDNNLNISQIAFNETTPNIRVNGSDLARNHRMNPNEVPNPINDTTSDRLTFNVDFLEQPEQFEIGQSFFMPTRQQAPLQGGKHTGDPVQSQPRWSIAYDHSGQVNQLAIQSRVDQQDEEISKTTAPMYNEYTGDKESPSNVGRVMFDDDENDIWSVSTEYPLQANGSAVYSNIDHIARELERLRDTERALEYRLLQQRKTHLTDQSINSEYTGKPTSPMVELRPEKNSTTILKYGSNNDVHRPSGVKDPISNRASRPNKPTVRLSSMLIKSTPPKSKLKPFNFPKKRHDVYNVAGQPNFIYPSSSMRSIDKVDLMMPSPPPPIASRSSNGLLASNQKRRLKTRTGQSNTRILPSSSTQWSTELKLDSQQGAKNEHPTVSKDADTPTSDSDEDDGDSDEDPRSLDPSNLPTLGSLGGDMNSVFNEIDAPNNDFQHLSPSFDSLDLFELRNKILPPANSPNSRRHNLAFYQRPRQYGPQLTSSTSHSYSPQQSLSRYHYHDLQQMSRPSYPATRKYFKTSRPTLYESVDHHSDGTHSHKVIHIHTKEKKKHNKYLWPILGGGLTMLMGFLIISNMLLSIPLLAIGASSLYNHGGYHTQQLIPVYNVSQLVPQRLGSGRRKRHVLSSSSGELQLIRPRKLLRRILESLAQNSNRCRVASVI